MRKQVVPLRKLCLSTTCAALLCATVTRLHASAPTPTPTSTPSAAASAFCMAAPGGIAPIPLTTSYAVMLEALDEQAGISSGILSLYAGDARYDIPFRGVISEPIEKFAEASPIVVHFPTVVKIDHGMIASLEGPGGGPCAPFVVDAGIGTAIRRSGSDAFLEKARAAKPIDAPSPISLPHPSCAEPDRFVTLKTAARAPIPSPEDRHLAEERINGTNAQANVGVVVDDQGRIVTTSVRKTSGDRNLDDSAIYAARHSVFAPQRFRCEDVGGGYLFVVEYVI